MVVVGLTGGIGSGKSTVAGMFASRGAAVIDADRVARQVAEPGGPVHSAIVTRFGPQVVGPDGAIDRGALAGIVFRDAGARRDLEAITHPVVRRLMARRVLDLAGLTAVVVLDIPLLAGRWESMSGVIVVDVPVDTAVERLVCRRGFDTADAHRRVAAQIDPRQRRAIADLVIDNSGDMANLDREVDRAWAWVTSLADST